MKTLPAGHATLVFCDLVGSTQLLSNLGNDASEEIRRSYFAALREVIRSAGGEEVKNLGDGLMVVFRSSPSDAVACAVGMQLAINRLNMERPPVTLSLRVGMAAGEASLAPEETDWFGPAVNTAARLCAAAQPGQVLSAGLALEGDIRGRLFGDLSLKGIPAPVPTTEICFDGRDNAPGVPAMPVPLLVEEGPPLVGRAVELGSLGDAWADARGGRPTVLTVTGEPGTGKTRLVRNFASVRVSTEGTVLYARCHTDARSLLEPLIEALRTVIACCDGPQLAEALDGRGPELATVLPWLQKVHPELCGSPGTLVRADPGRVEEALRRVVRLATSFAPVMLVLDDLHHASSGLVEALAALLGETPMPLLVVGLLREDGPSWAQTVQRLNGRTLRLNPLAVDDVERLVGDVLPRLPVSQRVGFAHLLAEETGGVAAHVLEALRHLAAARVDEDPRSTATDSAVRTVVRHTCPFRGLAPYRPADHALFFGRDELVKLLLERLRVGRVVGVLGPSGSGKSSLVSAGLIPALERGALGGSERWRIVAFQPGRAPFASLAAALSELPGVADLPQPLEADLRRDSMGLHRLAIDLVDDSNGRVLVVIDQFEELFTLTEDRIARDRFVDLLTEALSVPGGPLTLVIAMRADFYGHLAEHRALAGALETQHLLVGPMSPTELGDAIRQPAFVAGLSLEDGLVDVISQEVAGQTGALPLLSHALLETWRRRDAQRLTLHGYHDAGGVRGAIAHTADAIYEALSPDHQRRVARLFLRLVTPGEGTEDSRRRAELDEIPAALQEVVPPLVTARLLTADDGTIEVAHEALIREWPRLRGWLDEDREGLRLHRRITEAARAWQEAERDPVDLLRGGRLHAALSWAADHADDLNAAEVAFLAEGRTAEEAERQRAREQLAQERRANRRLRSLLVGFGVFAVLAVVAATVALVQQRRAHDSAALAAQQRTDAIQQRDKATQATRLSDLNRLMAQSKALAGGTNDLSLLLALEANRLENSPQTQSTILNALQAEPRFQGAFPAGVSGGGAAVVQPGGTVVRVAHDGTIYRWDLTTHQQLGPDRRPADVESFEAGQSGSSAVGRRLVAVSWQGRLQVFDPATADPVGPEIVAPLPDGRRFWALAFSPDDNLVYVGGGNGPTSPNTGKGMVAVFDPRTGERHGDVWQGHSSTIDQLALSPDGALLATGSFDFTAMVWDAQTGKPVGEPLRGHRNAVPSVAWSPDGRFLATTSFTPVELIIWDLATRQPMLRLPLTVGTFAWATYSPDGRRIAIAGGGGTAQECDASTGAAVGRPISVTGEGVNPTYTPDGRSLLTAGSRLLQWSVDGTPNLGATIPSGLRRAGRWSPDGSLLALAAVDGSAELLDGRTGRSLGPLLGLPPKGTYDRALAFSPDGRLLAVGGADGEVTVYDTSTHLVRVHLIDAALQAAYGLAFSPDGAMLAVGGHQRADLFNVTTGQLARQPIVVDPNKIGLVDVAFSPDGLYLYLYPFTHTILRYDLRSGQAVAESLHVTSMAVSADGTTVAAGLNGGLVQLMDPLTLRASGEPIAISSQAVAALAFTPDGRTLVVYNGKAVLVDVASRAVLDSGFTFDLGGGGARLAISPDSKRMVAPRDEGGTVIWDVQPAAWLAKACSVVGRNLTPAEWASYLPNEGTYRKTCDRWPV